MLSIVAFLLLAHGLAHTVGFAGSWGLSPDMPYHTRIFSGHLDVGDVGMRILGILWLLTSMAFAVVAFGARADTRWWPAAALGVATLSLVLTIAEWPSARIGAWIDIALIVLLAAVLLRGDIPRIFAR